MARTARTIKIAYKNSEVPLKNNLCDSNKKIVKAYTILPIPPVPSVTTVTVAYLLVYGQQVRRDEID